MGISTHVCPMKMRILLDVAVGCLLLPSRHVNPPHASHQASPLDSNESISTVIVGGGQAGLVMGYHLQRAGEQFVILDAHARIGDTWRNRWDSLGCSRPRATRACPVGQCG